MPHRTEIDFVANGSASATVTRRSDDGRYAFVEIDVELDAGARPGAAG